MESVRVVPLKQALRACRHLRDWQNDLANEEYPEKIKREAEFIARYVGG
ncbi:hypothetical protein [Parvularcula marina]